MGVCNVVRQSLYEKEERYVALYLIGIPFFDFLQGVASFFSFDAPVSVAYKLGIIALIVYHLYKKPVKYTVFFYPVLIFLLFLTSLSYHFALGSYGFPIIEEVMLHIKGPVFWSLCFLLFLFFNSRCRMNFLYCYSLSSWLVIGCSTVVLFVLGVNDGSSHRNAGFYAAPNEISFVFVFSWCVVFVGYFFTAKGLMSAAITSVVLYLLGTKSGFVVMALFFSFEFFTKFFKPRKAVLSVFFLGSLMVFFSSFIFMSLGPFLPGWERLEFTVSKYDVLTALTSGRFMDLDVFLSYLDSSSIAELFFGSGFLNFWSFFSGYSIESDPIDLIGSIGFLGASFFYFPIFIAVARGFFMGGVMSCSLGLMAFLMVCYTIFTGHVAFAPSPLVLLSLVVLIALKSSKDTFFDLELYR